MRLSQFPTLKIENPVRMSLNKILHGLFDRLRPGKVLEIGPTYSQQRDFVPHDEYMTLDIDPEAKADIRSNVESIRWEDNYFDTVLCCEVLEHVSRPQIAVNEIYRVLKHGGICILSTRFIQSYHPSPLDCWRFTPYSLAHLFCRFSEVEIMSQGNRLQAMWSMAFGGKLAIIGNVLNPIIGRMDWKDDLWPCGYVVWAKK